MATIGEKVDQYLKYREKADALQLKMQTILMYLNTPNGILRYRVKILEMLNEFEAQSEDLYNFIKDNPDLSNESVNTFINNCRHVVKEMRAGISTPINNPSEEG